LTSFVNLNKSRSYGGELIVSTSPAKFINLNGTFSFYRNELDASNLTGASSRSANIWSVRGVSNIIMPADLSMQLSYFYSGERVTPNGTISPMQSFDAAIKKDFFDKSLSVTLRATDIFNTAKFKYNFDDGTFIESSERFRDSRGLFLNLSYKFGKDDKKDRRKRDNENREDDDYIDY
jgi:iron complex outermembrane receptor protein